jgi:hypothetical protein
LTKAQVTRTEPVDILPRLSAENKKALLFSDDIQITAHNKVIYAAAEFISKREQAGFSRDKRRAFVRGQIAAEACFYRKTL